MYMNELLYRLFSLLKLLSFVLCLPLLASFASDSLPYSDIFQALSLSLSHTHAAQANGIRYQELVKASNNNCMQHTYIFVNKLKMPKHRKVKENSDWKISSHISIRSDGLVSKMEKNTWNESEKKIITKRWKINVSNGRTHPFSYPFDTSVLFRK